MEQSFNPGFCHWGFLELGFTSVRVLSDHIDCRFLLASSDRKRTDVPALLSQFALIRSNQGVGAAAGICGEIKLPLASWCLSQESERY